MAAPDASHIPEWAYTPFPYPLTTSPTFIECQCTWVYAPDISNKPASRPVVLKFISRMCHLGHYRGYESKQLARGYK